MGLTEFIDDISLHKKAGDRYNGEIQELTKSRAALINQLDRAHEYAGKMQLERDTFRDETMTLHKSQDSRLN